MATTLTTEEVRAIMEGFAKKAVAGITPPPKYEFKIDIHEGRHRWIGVDADFIDSSNSPKASQDSYKAAQAFGDLVDRDDRMQVDEEGGGDGFYGVSLSIGRDDDEDEDGADEE